jgi:hypothetical protein
VAVAAGQGGLWGAPLGLLLTGSWVPAAVGGALYLGAAASIVVQEARRVPPAVEGEQMQGTLMFVGDTRHGMGLRRGQVYRVTVRTGPGGPPVMSAPIRCPYDSWQAFWANWRPAGAPRLKGPWEQGTLDGEPWRCAARQAGSGRRCSLPRPHVGAQHDQPFAPR